MKPSNTSLLKGLCVSAVVGVRIKLTRPSSTRGATPDPEEKIKTSVDVVVALNRKARSRKCGRRDEGRGEGLNCSSRLKLQQYEYL